MIGMVALSLIATASALGPPRSVTPESAPLAGVDRRASAPDNGRGVAPRQDNDPVQRPAQRPQSPALIVVASVESGIRAVKDYSPRFSNCPSCKAMKRIKWVGPAQDN